MLGGAKKGPKTGLLEILYHISLLPSTTYHCCQYHIPHTTWYVNFFIRNFHRPEKFLIKNLHTRNIISDFRTSTVGSGSTRTTKLRGQFFNLNKNWPIYDHFCIITDNQSINKYRTGRTASRTGQR